MEKQANWYRNFEVFDMGILTSLEWKSTGTLYETLKILHGTLDGVYLCFTDPTSAQQVCCMKTTDVINTTGVAILTI